MSDLEIEQSKYKLKLGVNAAKLIGGTGAAVTVICLVSFIPNPLSAVAIVGAIGGAAYH